MKIKSTITLATLLLIGLGTVTPVHAAGYNGNIVDTPENSVGTPGYVEPNGTTNGGHTGSQVGGSYVEIHRLYNTRNMEHLYTASNYEAVTLANQQGDWKYEGVSWTAPKENTSGQVYRVYNPNSGEHLYTMSSYEVKVLSTQHGWKAEGVAFNSAPSTAKPIYRLYNPAAGVGAHFQTSSAYERDQLVKNAGWKYEGIAYYGNSI